MSKPHKHEWVWHGYRKLFVCEGYPTCQATKTTDTVIRILNRPAPRYREATEAEASEGINGSGSILYTRIPPRKGKK